jgi:hypothetical protein
MAVNRQWTDQDGSGAAPRTELLLRTVLEAADQGTQDECHASQAVDEDGESLVVQRKAASVNVNAVRMFTSCSVRTTDGIARSLTSR